MTNTWTFHLKSAAGVGSRSVKGRVVSINGDVLNNEEGDLTTFKDGCNAQKNKRVRRAEKRLPIMDIPEDNEAVLMSSGPTNQQPMDFSRT